MKKYIIIIILFLNVDYIILHLKLKNMFKLYNTDFLKGTNHNCFRDFRKAVLILK